MNQREQLGLALGVRRFLQLFSPDPQQASTQFTPVPHSEVKQVEVAVSTQVLEPESER